MLALLVFLLVCAVIFLFVRLDTLVTRLGRLERKLNELKPPPERPLIGQNRGAVEEKSVLRSLQVAVEAPPVAEPRFPSPSVQRHSSSTGRTFFENERPGSPDWFESAMNLVKRYFTEGNLFVRIGVIILFFGIAFLFRFAYQHSMLPVEFRLLGATLFAMALLIIGWRLRVKRTVYGLVLQGGGVGIMYLTIFAAFRLYHLLPGWLTFPLLLMIVILSAALAVMQNARALAVLGISGGFLAPVLASTGSGSHVGLFGYYAMLNIAILTMAWFKSWRMLNVLGFLFTFLIGTAWGITVYRAEFFASTEPFLLFFFLLYVVVAVLFAFRQPPDLKGYVDGTLVFGVPLVGFALQAALVRHYEYGLAWSAFAMGFFYLSLAWTIWQRGGAALRMLGESFLAMGTVFASLTIPFVLEGEWIATAWALEGAAVLWVGVRQRRRLATAFAILLQFGAGLGFIIEAGHRQAQWPVLNGVFLGALFVSLSGLFSAYYLYRRLALVANGDDGRKENGWAPLSTVMLIWGLLWWFANGLLEIDAYVASRHELLAALLFVAGSAAILGDLETRLSWQVLRYTLYGYAPALVLFGLIAAADQPHLFANQGYLGWLLAFGIYYRLLHGRDKQAPLKGLALLHTTGLLLLVAILAAELHWLAERVTRLGAAWRHAALAVMPVAALHMIMRARYWPFTVHRLRYLDGASLPLLMGLGLWSLLSNASPAFSMRPLPYLPFLNPLDIAHAIVLATLLEWWRTAYRNGIARVSKNQALGAVAALAFIWLNAVLLRSLHHWVGIPYAFNSMAESAVVQASLSIFWTLLGLAVMVVATRRGWRNVWLVAACLLGVVILKLFAVDFPERDTLAAIVSFIVVGVLMLVVGYFSPLPPKTGDELHKMGRL